MKNLIKNPEFRIRVSILLLADIFSVMLASFLALVIRFEFELHNIYPPFIEAMYQYMPVNIVCTVIIFYFFHMYTSLWKYASVKELSNVFLAVFCSGVGQTIGMHILNLKVPRSYYIIYTILLLFLEVAIRFSYRLMRFLRNEYYVREQPSNVMVIGAGDAGAAIIKEMRLSKFVKQKVCCVIDDNPAKQYRYIEGCQIVGNRS